MVSWCEKTNQDNLNFKRKNKKDVNVNNMFKMSQVPGIAASGVAGKTSP